MASSSKCRLNDNGNDERRRPRKRFEDRKKERLAHLHQKLRMCKHTIGKGKEREQEDENKMDDEEIHQNKLLPIEEPPMSLASCSNFPPDHWFEPIKEALEPLQPYPNHCVSVVIPPLPSSSPPAKGPMIGALRIPQIKCADNETSAAQNAHLVKAGKVPQMDLRERYPRGVQSMEDWVLIEAKKIGMQQKMTLRVIDRLEERQETKGNEANEEGEGKESEEKNESDVDE
ncbi:hypothetical protein GGU11DRAFT_851996 [Lentinula aff. detonsa]|nr:hypothetical protein GGU11DRAFT_851996 [Lentinula aff. detonsa]